MAGVRFSVILTVFGRQELVPYALYDVAQQMHADWELIVACDGPHPASEYVVRAISARDEGLAGRVRCVTFERRGGMWGNACRREGLEHATGDYVVWYGHDCTIDKDYLQAHAENIASSGRPCISVVGQRYHSAEGWAQPFPYPEGEPALAVYCRTLPPHDDAQSYGMGEIDLLNMSIPLSHAREHAFRPENDYTYEGDWLTFRRLREVLPVVVNRKVVCGHF